MLAPWRATGGSMGENFANMRKYFLLALYDRPQATLAQNRAPVGSTNSAVYHIINHGLYSTFIEKKSH
jgi:hypothetical protein